MHVEVRELRDPYRVRGAFNIKIVKPKEVPSMNVICGVVKLVEKHFVLLKPLDQRLSTPMPMESRACRRHWVLLCKHSAGTQQEHCY